MRVILGLLSLFYGLCVFGYNLPEHPIKSYECAICMTLSHDNLKDQWDTAVLPLNSMPSNIQKSYSYTKRITAKQLEQGISLPIQTPGAVLYITPLQNKIIPPIELKSPKGTFMNLKEASFLYSQDEALDNSLKTNLPQTILQIKPELGTGTFILRSQNKNINTTNADTYLVNVFEKQSLVYLQIAPSALHYQYGDEFLATISLKDDEGGTYPIQTIRASLVNPKNQTIPMELRKISDSKFQAFSTLLSEENTHGSNWYIEVEVNNNHDLLTHNRTGQAAFSYSIPSASLVSIEQISFNPLILKATLNVATASRYALESVLLHKTNNEELAPLEMAQSAQWLEPGTQTIELSFANSAQIDEDQLFLGFLHLIDYGQLKPIYKYDSPIKLSQILD